MTIYGKCEFVIFFVFGQGIFEQFISVVFEEWVCHLRASRMSWIVGHAAADIYFEGYIWRRQGVQCLAAGRSSSWRVG